MKATAQPAVPRRVADRGRHRAADRLVEELVQVGAPADRDGRHRDRVLQQQAPPAHPRHQLAEGRVGVGVGRAGHRDRPGELGVGQRGEQRRHRGEHERQHHGRTRLRHRLPQHHEDPGAEGRAHAEQGQLEQAHRAPQLAALAPPALGDDPVDRLGPHQRPRERPAARSGGHRPLRRRPGARGGAAAGTGIAAVTWVTACSPAARSRSGSRSCPRSPRGWRRTRPAARSRPCRRSAPRTR